MKKLILCVLSAAVVAQIWGMISWMVLPWHGFDFRQFKDSDVIAEVFRGQTQGSGIYAVPNIDPSIHGDEKRMAEWNEKAQRGPFAFLSVREEGVNPGMGPAMAIGFLLNVLIAAGLFWLVSQTTITCPKGRTVFIAVAGAIGALYPHMSNWNWWGFPLSYCVVGVVDLFVTWGLAGFTMVKIADRMGGSSGTRKRKARA